MSFAPEGFDPSDPLVVAFEIKFLAKDVQTADEFVNTVREALDKIVDVCIEVTHGAIELVEREELPPTEVVDRDEV